MCEDAGVVVWGMPTRCPGAASPTRGEPGATSDAGGVDTCPCQLPGMAEKKRPDVALLMSQSVMASTAWAAAGLIVPGPGACDAGCPGCPTWE